MSSEDVFPLRFEQSPNFYGPKKGGYLTPMSCTRKTDQSSSMSIQKKERSRGSLPLARKFNTPFSPGRVLIILHVRVELSGKKWYVVLR